MRDVRLHHWPPFSRKREIQDVVHGPISLFHPLDCVVDTREFQRLRELKQLGVTYLVYPCSTHSRFVHCLGTYWLAFKFVEVLKREPSLGITSQEHLCVSLAALCHDLGHGPFSHLFETAFEDVSDAPKIAHEKLSIELLRRIVKQNGIREQLELYLGEGDEFERNIAFVEELISSQKFDSSGQWLPRGRPVEKAFLYDIVSNDNDSFDVDKFDYLIRDSQSANFAIPLDKHNIERLMENAKVLPDPDRGFPRICYAHKTAENASAVGEARQMLHNRVYRHRVVFVIEAMVVKALTLADKHLSYMGDDGREYTLSNTTLNMGAYLRTSDGVLRDIANSTLPGMAEAQRVLRDIELRNIPKKVEEAVCTPFLANKRVSVPDGSSTKLEDWKKLVMQRLRETLGEEFDHEQVLVLAAEMHRGLDGRSNPMSRLLLYDVKRSGMAPYTENEKVISLKCPQEPAIWSICLYVSRSMDEEKLQRVSSTFTKICEELGMAVLGSQRVRST